MASTPSRAWQVLLIHHAHTDIGYTDGQRRIERSHRQYLDRVLELRRRAREPGDESLRGFRWSSECYWSIESWLRHADGDRADEMAEAIRDGTIGLSATYLHFNELIDRPFLLETTRRAVDYGRSIGVGVDSALSADINGFSWGYADVLAELGVRNLMVCSHAHHGLAAIGRRQAAFRWVAPSGAEVLVWNGEHYMLGNVMGLCPGALLSYTFRDELRPGAGSPDHLFYAERRLPRYLAQLEADGYPYDFVPLNVAGMTTDNAPPNPEIAWFIARWNERHGDRIKLSMTTPSAFFARLREAAEPIPSHAGDWPDWWSDGLAASPDPTRQFRDAQRWYRAILEDPELAATLADPRRAEIESLLPLYPEHTFSHRDSMWRPWDRAVRRIAGQKQSIAYRLAGAVEQAMDEAQVALGQVGPRPGRALRYRVMNPSAASVRDVAWLELEELEHDVAPLAAEVWRVGGEAPLAHQVRSGLHGVAYGVRLDLGPHERCTLELRPGRPTLRHDRRVFSDQAALPGGVPDAVGIEAQAEAGANADGSLGVRLVTPSTAIACEAPIGVTRWIDRGTGRSLLRRDAPHPPFTPVYEVTPVEPVDDAAAQVRARGAMGRNRKGRDVRRCVGELIDAQLVEAGPLYTTARLRFRVEGVELYHVLLAAWADLPRVDVAVRMNKQSAWSPENLYVALPLGTGLDGQELWLDKAGAMVRPWRDQLPDTLTDFYSVQEGFCWRAEGFGLVVSTPDTPLLQLGPLEHGQRRLMGHPGLSDAPMHAYGWLMTNYWETNFEASLGGFYEFRYRVEWGEHLAEPGASLARCRALNLGLPSFRVDE